MKVKIIVIVISIIYHIQAENQLNMSYYDSLIPHAQATVDDDEDDEGDNDCFLPNVVPFQLYKFQGDWNIVCFVQLFFFWLREGVLTQKNQNSFRAGV